MGSVSWVDLELYDLNNPICVCVCVHGTLDAALLTIFPEAGLQNNCIRTSHYRFVLRSLLYWWYVSNCHDNKWLSCDELSCPIAYACMLRRLRAELKFVRSEDGSDSKNGSDPRRFYPCLSDLAFDMDKASALVEPKDGEVHVFKETKPYEECLLSVAQVLENRKGISFHLSLNAVCNLSTLVM